MESDRGCPEIIFAAPPKREMREGGRWVSVCSTFSRARENEKKVMQRGLSVMFLAATVANTSGLASDLKRQGSDSRLRSGPCAGTVEQTEKRHMESDDIERRG